MQIKNRVLCLCIAFVMVFTIIPLEAFAIDAPQISEDEIIQKEIVGVKKFSNYIANQEVALNKIEDVKLPDKLEVKFKDSDEYTSIDLYWNKTEVKKVINKLGRHTITPKIDDKYILVGVKIPNIELKIVKANTSIKDLKVNRTQKARSTMSDIIYINPGNSRVVKLQMKNGGKWKTMKTYKTSKYTNTKLKIIYPKIWWYVSNSYWRILVPATSKAKGYISKTIKVHTKRYYQNPKKYAQIKDKISLKESGGYNLKLGYMGLKVKKVNRFFHIGNRYWPRYTRTTKNRVKAFQRKKHLKVTGVVDKKTWLKMGFSSKSWYSLGAYVTPVKVNPASTKSQHIETMIKTAEKYLGDDYVVGASGKPGQGTDCSGLVMQALYSVGIDPYPVNVVRHAKPGYEFESRNLYKSKKFKKVSYRNKKRGDLVFYCGRNGVVNHVAIYLGNGKIIESNPNRIVVNNVRGGRGDRIIKGVRRVFN